MALEQGDHDNMVGQGGVGMTDRPAEAPDPEIDQDMVLVPRPVPPERAQRTDSPDLAAIREIAAMVRKGTFRLDPVVIAATLEDLADALEAQAERLARALEQADVAQRSAEAWEQNYNTLNGEIMAGIERQLTEARAEAAEQRRRAERMEQHILQHRFWPVTNAMVCYECDRKAPTIAGIRHADGCGVAAALAPVEPAS